MYDIIELLSGLRNIFHFNGHYQRRQGIQVKILEKRVRMMRILRLLTNKEIILYLVFGVLTTLVNFGVYFFLKSFLEMDMLLANSFAWIFSVLFAYLTNRRWVFDSNVSGITAVSFELIKFVFYRGLSFVIDMLSMLLLIEFLNWKDFYAKLITQVIVVVANFLFSKWLIFKN